MYSEFTNRVLELIKSIPEGKVSTYGEIARQAGDKRGARRVAEILHSLSRKHNLPWQRVINAKGKIAFKNVELAVQQQVLLEKEGIVFVDETVDLQKYAHSPKQPKLDGFL